MEQQWDWEPVDVLRAGSHARAGKGVDAVLAAMLVGPVVRLRESSCRVARRELPRSRRIMVREERVSGAGGLLGSLVLWYGSYHAYHEMGE